MLTETPTLTPTVNPAHSLTPRRPECGTSAQVSWRVRWAEYAPVAFTHAAVHANNRLLTPGGWADPPDCALLRREWRPNPTLTLTLTRTRTLTLTLTLT